jgi:hypothetical protein
MSHADSSAESSLSMKTKIIITLYRKLDFKDDIRLFGFQVFQLQASDEAKGPGCTILPLPPESSTYQRLAPLYYLYLTGYYVRLSHYSSFVSKHTQSCCLVREV